MKILTGLSALFLGCLLALNLSWAEIPAQSTDAAILGVLSVTDENEILSAQLAEQKNIDKDVLDYARTLDADHNAHLQKVRQLSHTLGLPIMDNAFLQKLRTEGRQDRDALTALDSNDFAQLFLADMIKAHSEALNWLDNQNAQNDQVKAFLKNTQAQLARHFKMAQKIQEKNTPGQ